LPLLQEEKEKFTELGTTARICDEGCAAEDGQKQK
jgi:hypothetical protein